VNALFFFYDGVVCVSLTLLGLLLTVLEFHRMSARKNPIDRRDDLDNEGAACEQAGGVAEGRLAVVTHRQARPAPPRYSGTIHRQSGRNGGRSCAGTA
jgi:hypothetical protein